LLIPSNASIFPALILAALFMCAFIPTIIVMKHRRNQAKTSFTNRCTTQGSAVIYTGQRRLRNPALSGSAPLSLFDDRKEDSTPLLGHEFHFANHRYATYFSKANGGNIGGTSTK
jgi:hypothetical protein